jgi:hypothetical protein
MGGRQRHHESFIAVGLRPLPDNEKPVLQVAALRDRA